MWVGLPCLLAAPRKPEPIESSSFPRVTQPLLAVQTCWHAGESACATRSYSPTGAESARPASGVAGSEGCSGCFFGFDGLAFRLGFRAGASLNEVKHSHTSPSGIAL